MVGVTWVGGPESAGASWGNRVWRTSWGMVWPGGVTEYPETSSGIRLTAQQGADLSSCSIKNASSNNVVCNGINTRDNQKAIVLQAGFGCGEGNGGFENVTHFARGSPKLVPFGKELGRIKGVRVPERGG